MSDLRVPIFGAAALVLFLSAAAQASLVYIDRARLRHILEEGRPRATALMHLLEETARHAGHADILRELIDGRTGR